MKSGVKKYDKYTALEKVKHYCAYQERCHSEVKTKLYNWGLYSGEVNEIISDLIAENYLNEERFAESFVSGKFRIKGWGKIKIKQHLILKKVSKRCIEDALKTIDEDEYQDKMKGLALKKRDQLSTNIDAWTKKSKVGIYLTSKGYEYSEIQKILNEIEKI